jgi:MFS family permease
VADRHDRVANAVTYGVLALTMADNTMVGVAVPAVRGHFHLGVTSLQWIVAGYVVAFAGLLFTGGALGDRYGRRRALVAGVLVFGAGALMAGVAANWPMLLVGRFVQGIGAACSEPGTLSLLRQVYPDAQRRSRVLGGWAAASGVALAAGPVAAGLLLATGGWRAVFLGEALAGVALGLAGARLLPESRDPGIGRDGAGQVAVAITLVATTYALIEGQNRGFGALRVVVGWVVALTALISFLAVERRRDDPVLDLRVLRDRHVAGGLVAAAASSFALFSVLLLVSLDLQVVGGYPGLVTAGVFTPMTAAMVGAGLLGGRWAGRRRAEQLLVSGLVTAAVALLALDLSLSRPVRLWALVLTLTVMGAGLGLVIAPMVGTVLARVPARRSGMAEAAVTAGREVGGVLGVAVLGAIVSAQLLAGLTARLERVGIPVGYRHIVIDAIRNGSPIPKEPKASGGLLNQIVANLKQSVIDRVVDAGKSAYVDSLRTALLVGVGVLVAGAVGVIWLSRHTESNTPESVGEAC